VPIYEYSCQDCNAQFEKFVRSITSEAVVKCPECGGVHVKKGWSLFGTGSANGSLASLSASAASCGPTGST
jgi:putative FmdB family regulatory protein